MVYQEIENRKAEIEDVIEHLFPDKDVDIQNSIKKVIKNTLFFKYLEQEYSDYYISSIISDYMYFLYSLRKLNYRYMNLNLRSIIEYSLKTFLEEETDGAAKTYDLINRSKEKYSNNSSIIVDFNVIESIYSNTCDFIHGNINAQMPIISYFDEIDSLEEDKNTTRRTLNHCINVSKELQKLLLISHKYIIDGAFHRKKSLLEYLINKSYRESLLSAV